ncbi:hypothetical protein Harreka1_43 [Olleya phage Harreka_1]|uniref:Uncharacterized protein n=1 Tax=Olleya phage Harreka_1 TaxID=2745673 RepID=A0A8E4ZEQ7_9CAUD|nr:hypothetical protein M1M26_gp43 [Olleya phage Harreka_1]QQV90450.1 hypothetical protein Harreka1_43 [Olleya phage Harreka_1]
MRITGRFEAVDASQEEILDNDMEQEIADQKEHLHKYDENLKSLVGIRRSKEVKKAMINFLLETL